MTYQSKTAPWPHQVACREWMAERFAAGENGLLLALPMGVGKSKVAIDTVGEAVVQYQDRWLAKQDKEYEPFKVLILCPLSVVNVWPREFKKHCPWPYCVTAPGGTNAGRIVSFEWAIQERDVAVCVVHYDAAWREPLASWLLAQKWNIVIADESHKFKALPRYSRKNDGSGYTISEGKLAGFMAKLGRRAAYRLALTGTPMAHSPADIFSQIRFLDGGKRFGESPIAFLDRYRPISSPGAPWVNQFEMSSKLDEIMWRCPEDVVELPEAVHETLEFDLSSEGRRAYKEMWREMVAEVEEGEITAQNGAVRFLRLQQISSGIGRLDDGETTVRIDAQKATTFMDFLDDIDPAEKVVVFCQFRDELAQVREAAEAAGRVYGEISGSEKTGLSADALFAEGRNVVGAQLQSGGVGIDLTAARYCVYFSPGLSLANYEQSLKRVWRPGQTRPVLFVHMIAKGTVDGELYERLSERKDLVESILDMARSGKAIAA